MKLVIASLLVLSATQAFAYGAESLFFNCRSPHAKIYVAITRSEADGVSIDEVKFQNRSIETEVTSNSKFGEDVAPTRLAFHVQKHTVALKTAKDMIETSLNGGVAKLTIDGKSELMICKP